MTPEDVGLDRPTRARGELELAFARGGWLGNAAKRDLGPAPFPNSSPRARYLDPRQAGWLCTSRRSSQGQQGDGSAQRFGCPTSQHLSRRAVHRWKCVPWSHPLSCYRVLIGAIGGAIEVRRDRRRKRGILKQGATRATYASCIPVCSSSASPQGMRGRFPVNRLPLRRASPPCIRSLLVSRVPVASPSAPTTTSGSRAREIRGKEFHRASIE